MMWGHNDPDPSRTTHDGKYTIDSTNFKFYKDPENGYSLKFNVPMLYGGEHNYTEIGQHMGTNFVTKVVPVGQDAFERAFEASREGVRELKMVDPKTGIRLQETQQAARFALDKLKKI